MFLRFLILFTLSFNLTLVKVLAKDKEIVSFDLDETLIASNKLHDSDFKKVINSGYELLSSKKGLKFVIRPDAERVLEHAQSLDFKIIVITHNIRKYAEDILNSSGLFRYIDEIISNEDLKKSYNRDFQTYPYHRNRTYPQQSFLRTWTVGFYKSFIAKGFLNLIGNKNIHPFLPSRNINKYPPIYGSRFHVDNAIYNVENPLDFVGVKVTDFLGTSPEPKDANGNYIWSKQVMEQLDFLKQHGWVELYRRNYGKDPINEIIPNVSLTFLNINHHFQFYISIKNPIPNDTRVYEHNSLLAYGP